MYTDSGTYRCSYSPDQGSYSTYRSSHGPHGCSYCAYCHSYSSYQYANHTHYQTNCLAYPACMR